MKKRIIYTFDACIFYEEDVEILNNDCKSRNILEMELEELYKFFEVTPKHKGSLKLSEVKEKVVSEMLNIMCKSNLEKLKSEIKNCRRCFYYWEDINLIVYFINEALNRSISQVKKCSNTNLDREDYAQLIKYACYYSILDKNSNIPELQLLEEEKKHLYSCDYTYVCALKYISNELKLNLEINNIIDCLEMVFDKIYTYISQYGICDFFECLITELEKNYASSENYILVDNDKNFDLPTLYHMTIKLLTDSQSNNTIHTKISFENIRELTKAAIVLLDVNNENNLQFIIQFRDTNYLKKLINYSAVYDLHQCNQEGILFLIDRIINSFQCQVESAFNMSTDQVKECIKYIIEYENRCFLKRKIPKLSCAALTLETLPKKLVDFLENIRAKKFINKDYTIPLKWNCITDDSECIINIDNNYYILPMLLSTWGLYDKLSERINFPNYGQVLEYAIHDLFKKIDGISVYNGNYLLDGIIYESDALILIENNAIVIECKTKPLTRKARGGNKEDILSDIAKSYFTSQTQAMRVERAIYVNDSLEFYPIECKPTPQSIKSGKHKDSVITIDCSEIKNVLRITCTLGNYWIFSEPAIKNNISQLYKDNQGNALKEIDNYVCERNKLALFEDYKKKNLILNSLFISFDKLFSIIEKASKENLYKKLYSFTRIQDKKNSTMNHIREFEKLI